MIKFSKTKLNKVAKKYGLADIYLFGSKITGFQRKDSDLDIGVRFKNNLPEIEKRGKIYGELFSDLSVCFEKQKIDLIFIEEAPLHFKFKIVASGQLIYSADMKNSLNFIEYVVNYYRDYKYFIDMFFEESLKTSARK